MITGRPAFDDLVDRDRVRRPPFDLDAFASAANAGCPGQEVVGEPDRGQHDEQCEQPGGEHGGAYPLHWSTSARSDPIAVIFTATSYMPQHR